MNAMQQRPVIRSVETVHIIIDSQRRIVDQMVSIAADFLSLDTRPLIFDGQHCERVGPSPVPDELIKMIGDERDKLATLEGELYEAHQRECAYRDYITESSARWHQRS